MTELSQLEEKYNFHFPEIYKKFYQKCKSSTPKGMVGTDLFNNHNKLKEWAIELLNENNTENFLKDDDFVFMMHQGYIFWYFQANGNPNPIVYGYNEEDLLPKRISDLKNFLNEYPNN